MAFFERFKTRSLQANAQSAWTPNASEIEALCRRSHVDGLSRVDQIWDWLKADYGELIAVDAPHVTHPESFTYKELAELITFAAAAFLKSGFKKGDVVALFSENSPRWLIADQGLMRIGAIDAVRGLSAPVEELRYILDDSKAVGLIVQNADLWKKLDLNNSVKNRFKLILQLEGESIDGLLSWQEFLKQGNSLSTSEVKVDRGRESAKDAIATILYTSGTTGRPKGVPLTHANFLHQIKSLACVANPPPGSSILSVLPIWHSYERSAEYYFFSCGCHQTYTTIKHLKADLPRVRPVVMATVPRLWEAIQEGFDDALKSMPHSRQVFLRLLINNSASFKLALRTTRDLLLDPTPLKYRFLAALQVALRCPIHAFASFLIWPKILKKLSGGALLYPINGGGAIAPHVDTFFEALGVELLVGYGLTETSPVVSCRRPWRNIRGSSGLPLPETEFRIVDLETGSLKNYRELGRVLVKGPQVMSGYLDKPEETRKVLDPEGWFDTGDLGMLLPDGSVVLTGRAKDTIVLSNGENIEPGPLEEVLVASPLLEQVMLVGQDQKHLGALVVPKTENILIWAKEENGVDLPIDLGGSPGDQVLRALLRKEINLLLKQRTGSRSEERVIGIALVAPFTLENGLLTQTLKQRRDRISKRDDLAISSIFDRN